MPLGLRKWTHGGVEYPVTDATSESFLKVADPALYYAIELFSAVIEEYAGPALLARAAVEDLRFPSAIARTIHYEPSPFLLSDDLQFPLFCLYRSEEAWDRQSMSADKDDSIWTWAYVLPPLTPRQIEKLNPALRMISVVVSSFAMQSFDPHWEGGKTLRDLAGIAKMTAGPVRYMDFEKLEGGQGEWWRAVTGRIFVQERNGIVLEDLDVFDGANIDVDLDTPEGKIEQFVEVDSHLAPVLDRIEPSSGSKAGGVPFRIVGTGFRVGTPIKVLIGGSYASSVRVASPFEVTGLTPEHAAHPTFAADVQVIDLDGQPSNVLEGAYTFTTP